jgi:hypothetical protein
MKHIKQLEGTKYIKYAVEAWHYLLLNEGCGNAIQIHSEHSALVLEKGEDFIGMIIFKHVGDEYHIGMGYVKHKYRNKNYYQVLWDELVFLATIKKVTHIYGDCFINNHPILNFMNKNNRNPHILVTRYKI